MDSAGYTAITRLSGLNREMDTIANNIANISTTGFRKEGLIFSEYIQKLEPDEPSLSMADAGVRHTQNSQGALTQTGGTFDLAIEGDGFFLVETPQGEALTRAGSFTPNAEGDLVTNDGNRVLDVGGAPIFVPPDAKSIAVASDGTMSADGQPLTQIGLYLPIDPNSMNRTNGVMFTTDAGVEPVEDVVIVQGFVEGSNVNAVSEITRMIEVQHAFELSQTFVEKEDERIRSVFSTLGR
jgi:flagellar basal-body rod protein FlgF